MRWGRTVQADYLSDRQHYPKFGPRALLAQVVGSLSEPLEFDGAIVGSINLFARETGGLGDHAIRPTRLLAAQASAAVTATLALDRLRRQVAQLEQALESRDIIGQAKGVLMLRSGLRPDEAFTLLVRALQRENRKLRDIAQDIADRASRPRANGSRGEPRP
ncbi:MAG: hypothetical protein QOE93_2496 [Actinomycetota bacterium]|nr:hypothetical protein [Actinomycetota bacterium]